jgi:mycothiol synthase
MTMDAPRPASDVEIRGLDSDRDFDEMAAIMEACREADGYDTSRSGGQLRVAISNWPDFDPAEGVRIATAAGQVVAYAYGVHDGDNAELGRLLFHDGRVLPAWRGRAIGRRLLAEAQDAACRHAARRPGPEPGSTVYRALVSEADRDARRLLEHDGYAIARYGFSMIRPSLADPPSPDLPAGLDVRPATPENAMQIVRAMAEAMSDQWGFPQLTDDDLVSHIRHPLWGQIDAWQVAWDGDEVAGGVLGFINHDENRELGRARGYTEAIFTRRPWRRRGVASALIGRNLRLLAERGMTEAALGVDAENPTGALAVYERAGFVCDRTDLLYQRAV